MKINNITALAAAGAITCCATPVNYNPVLPYNAEAVPVDAITIMPDPLPSEATAQDLPTDYAALSDMTIAQTNAMVNAGTVSPAAGAAGGIIGTLIVAAIDASIDANRNSKFREMLAAQEVDGPTIFQTALEAAVTDSGIQVSFAEGSRDGRDYYSNERIADIANGHVLDVLVANYGYRIHSAGWVPSVAADVILKDPATGTVLMKERVAYGAPGGTAVVASPYVQTFTGGLGSSTVIVAYEEGYTFKNVDAFTNEDPERAAKGLELALQQTAAAIADLVKQPISGDIIESESPPDATEQPEETPVESERPLEGTPAEMEDISDQETAPVEDAKPLVETPTADEETLASKLDSTSE